MKRKQIKQLFIESMGESEFWLANGKYENTLLRDIPYQARLYHWNYVFYTFNGNKHGTRAEMFETYGYKDLRHETL